jgi:ATP-binding cassette subfamily B protein
LELVCKIKNINYSKVQEKLTLVGLVERENSKFNTFSLGMKQRLAIASALLNDPEILILDDCLSAVDSHTENKILNYFQSSLKDKTAIIISHRIYVNLHFDKILVFQDGEVAHAGTHEELLKISPYYLDLYERQLSDERMD